jgi:hypothetical protein
MNMGVTDAIGKIIKVLQKANQIEIIGELIEIQQKVVEMQEGYMKLQKENEDLKSMKELEADIIRHQDGHISRKSEEGKNLHYCGVCWGKYRNRIPLEISRKRGDSLTYVCIDKKCGSTFGGEERGGVYVAAI